MNNSQAMQITIISTPRESNGIGLEIERIEILHLWNERRQIFISDPPPPLHCGALCLQ